MGYQQKCPYLHNFIYCRDYQFHRNGNLYEKSGPIYPEGTDT